MTSQVKCSTIRKRLDKAIKYYEDALSRWEANGRMYVGGGAIPKMMEKLIELKQIRGGSK